MKRLLFAPLLLLTANAASAYEFNLQFPVPAGARNLVVAGYSIDPVGKTVLGNCSYVVYSACSGRGCHSVPHHYNNTCTWDFHGNLLHVVSGAPPQQVPLSQNGTEIIYALDGKVSTGRDSRGFGFVNTPAAHYSWQTPDGTYQVIPYAPYMVAATLISDGDLSLKIKKTAVAAVVSGAITPSAGKAAITDDSCSAVVSPGSSCTITVTYDPTKVSCTNSGYGYAYTGIDLSLSSNAGLKQDFTQRYTVTGVPLCDNNN